MKNRLIMNDFLLVALIILLLLLSAFLIYKPSSSEYVTVMYNGDFYGKYSMYEDITEVIGDSGVIFEIKDGRAYIEHSDCPDEICKNSPDITPESSSAASIVCLPNKITVTKNSNISEKEADVIAG